MTDEQLPFNNQEFADILGDVPAPAPSKKDGTLQAGDQKLSLDQHPVAAYITSLNTTSSQRTQKQALDKMAKMLGNSDALNMDWSKLRAQHTTILRKQLIQIYSPATVNKYLTALRCVLKLAYQLGQISAENYHRASQLKYLERNVDVTGRELSAGEIAALMSACDDGTSAGIRDSAIIVLMVAAGMRRSEIIMLETQDFEDGKLTIRGNEKHRSIIVDNGALQALEAWLSLRGREPGALFLAINKGGEMRRDKRLTAQAVYNLLKKRAAQANLNPLCPNDLRRTFIREHINAGTDIAMVAQMAGHKDLNTTMRYRLNMKSATQGPAKILPLPYKRHKR